MKAPSNTHLTQAGYIRLPQVLEVIPIGRSTWWSWVASGKAPKGVKLGSKTTAWRVSDIEKLLSQLNEGGTK